MNFCAFLLCSASEKFLFEVSLRHTTSCRSSSRMNTLGFQMEMRDFFFASFVGGRKLLLELKVFRCCKRENSNINTLQPDSLERGNCAGKCWKMENHTRRKETLEAFTQKNVEKAFETQISSLFKCGKTVKSLKSFKVKKIINFSADNLKAFNFPDILKKIFILDIISNGNFITRPNKACKCQYKF